MDQGFKGKAVMKTSVLDRPIDEILKERLGVDRADVVALCDRFRIVELGLFGSVLRDDFRAEGSDPSDVDLLVVFEEGYRQPYEDYLDLVETVEALFRRKVDICQKELLKNPYSRADILRTNQVIYAS
jgi:uncharacterized protein